MVLFTGNKKPLVFLMTVLAALSVAAVVLLVHWIEPATDVSGKVSDDEKALFEKMLGELFSERNGAVLDNDATGLEKFYNTSTRYGKWAYEHQVRKTVYLHRWSDKQGVNFINISTDIVVRSLKEYGKGYRSYFMCSTAYDYAYEDAPLNINRMRIGTYHSMDIVLTDKGWVVGREWYTDPFADSLELDDIKKDDFKNHILENSARDFSNIKETRIAAAEYADRYCGAANPTGDYSYNKKYKNYNPLGGDCANFASQVLHEGGGFGKTYTWNYGKDGSKAWLNAQAFKGYLLYSGRASLIAYGTYEKVFKSSYKLLPGDMVAYERKGKVKHVSVVTGTDSRGYALVNCHNTDRYKVPWDLGWSDSKIRFYLIRVHY